MAQQIKTPRAAVYNCLLLQFQEIWHLGLCGHCTHMDSQTYTQVKHAYT